MLDKTNLRILQLLQNDARLSYAELGKQVNLSAPAVADRIHKMEDKGIISGYRAEVDVTALGFPITAFVIVQVFRGQEQIFIKFVKTLPEVLVCHNVTGEKAFIAQVAVRSMSHLDDLLEQLNQYSDTSTMLILSTVVPSRIIDGRYITS